uniref:GPI ethanolamine phosphate transferase 3, catalytic subunit n=1 Tax=Knipowitschia caucasica TaxID=637954 RepID=A0AAV2J375_KNICA
MLRALCRSGGLLLKQSQQTAPRLWVTPAQQRWASSLPMNTVVLFVPQQEAWVVERMGRFHRILEPGLNFLIPVLDRVRYVQSLKEIVIDVPEQSAVSLDNVTLQIDGVLYLRILDPFKASYGVEDPEYAVTQLAQTTMRSELGKLTLDKVFRERESLNSNIVHSINQASDEWGIRCLRYEIKDIHVPPRVKESMQMQAQAERKKRATVLESEGSREAAINVAEGRKQSQILASEGEKAEQINQAAGEAQAVLAKAEAKAKAIRLLSDALTEQNGNAAASLSVAEQYVSAFSNLAKQSNTILLPTNTGDISGMVTQAMTIYSTLAKTNTTIPTSAAKPDKDTLSPATRMKWFPVLSLLSWSCAVYITGIYLFVGGFLLVRLEVNRTSSCLDALYPGQEPERDFCKGQPRFHKAVLLIIDALKIDFARYDANKTSPRPYENKLPVLEETVSAKPSHSRLYPFRADPPTTTMQRIKGFTTGSLPTFIDVGNNFASSAILEDNLIQQLGQVGKRVVFMGDDTWENLYPKRFHRSLPFPSFNVKDLHTVDDGILQNIYSTLEGDDWDVLVAHFLGVDHCGHRFGPDHPAMADKLTQMDGVIRSVMRRLQNDTLLVVMGDHGMTDTGDHGGESQKETDAAIFIYSPSAVFQQPQAQLEPEVVPQTDLVPTLALLLGIPIPFSSVGQVLLPLFPPHGQSAVGALSQQEALWINAKQVNRFLETYSSMAKDIAPETLSLLQSQFSRLSSEYVSAQQKGLLSSPHITAALQAYLTSVRDTCRATWAKFNPLKMAAGLFILALACVACLHWAVSGTPEDSFKNLSELIGLAQLALPRAAYCFLTAGLLLIWLDPLTVFIKSKTATQNRPAPRLPPRYRASIGISPQAELHHLIPQIYQQMRQSLDDGETSGEGGEDSRPAVEAYGLGTVYSAPLLLLCGMLGLVLLLLHPEGMSLAFLLLLVEAGALLHIHASACNLSRTQAGGFNVPWTPVVLWALSATQFFHATGHLPTFPSIQWGAAFVGFPDGHSGTALPAALVTLNTFSSHILLAVSCPLLLLWPLVCEVHSGRGGRAGGDEVDDAVMEIRLRESPQQFSSALLQLSARYLFVQGAQVFASVCAAAILRRHLMVWKVFAPKLMFEASAFIVTSASLLLGVTFVLRTDSAVTHWFKRLVPDASSSPHFATFNVDREPPSSGLFEVGPSPPQARMKCNSCHGQTAPKA